GQVDDEGAAGGPGVAAAERGVGGLGPAGGPDGLHDPGDLPVQQRFGHLRGAVVRGEPGAAAGDDDRRVLLQQSTQCGADRLAVGHDGGVPDREAVPGEPAGDHRGTAVGVDAGGGPGGGDQDRRVACRPAHAGSSRVQSPLLPPDLASTFVPEITACLSTALVMSYRARAATEAAVRASISTPVTPRVETVASIRTLPASASGKKSTVA